MAVAHQSMQYECCSDVDMTSVPFLTEMLALVPAVVYIFSHQTMSNEYSSRSIGEMLGYGPDEIKAMGDNLLPIIVHPEDFDLLAEHVGSLQTLATGERAVWEYRAIRADGSEVWLRSVEAVFARTADGGVLRHIGIAFDITDEKMQLAQLHAEVAELKKAVADRTP